MAASWTAWSNAIFDAVKAVVGSGVTVYWSEQGNAPMPPKPCVAIDWGTVDVSQNSLGGGTCDEVQGQNDSAGTWKIVHHRAHLLTLDFYSNGVFGDDHARAKLGVVLRGLQSGARSEALRLAGLKIQKSAGLLDLSALLDTRAESRAHLDLWLVTADTTADVVGWIETADVTATVTAPEGTVP